MLKIVELLRVPRRGAEVRVGNQQLIPSTVAILPGAALKNIKYNLSDRLKNCLFAISHEPFGSVGSLNTHFEGFIEPDGFPLQSDQFMIIKML